METELTKEIKIALHSYNPKMNSSMRTIRYADEVWTPHGIVDVIRFEDYVVSRDMRCRLVDIENQNEKDIEYIKMIGRVPGECKIKGLSYPNENCKGCIFHQLGPAETDMMITAFEIKITKADFLTGNGRNIDNIEVPIGNENYYCVPKSILKDVESLIPEHVGILTYHGHGYIRKYRKCKWLEVEDSVKIKLLYNSLKKWCDGKQ